MAVRSYESRALSIRTSAMKNAHLRFGKLVYDHFPGYRKFRLS